MSETQFYLGVRKRFRGVIVPPSDLGIECPNLSESQPCKGTECYTWSAGTWGSCQLDPGLTKCGPGHRTRLIYCITHHKVCKQTSNRYKGQEKSCLFYIWIHRKLWTNRSVSWKINLILKNSALFHAPTIAWFPAGQNGVHVRSPAPRNHPAWERVIVR